MQLAEILNLYTKKEQEFLKKSKKIKNVIEHYYRERRRYDADW